MRRLMIVALAGATCLAGATFEREEREAIVRFWNTPGRYEVTAPDGADRTGPWQVRLTAEGSLWLWNYNKARGLAKGPPSQVPPPTPEAREWEAWIDAKVARDRWDAGEAARMANGKLLGRQFSSAAPEPPEPGPAPQSLLNLAGPPPSFAGVVAPLRHIVRLEPGSEFVYQDNPNMRPRFAYYRFPQGVMLGGKAVRTLPAQELDALLQSAGIGPAEGRVMRSVSLLEGGFESINTYDTGFLSVGFIQFATLAGGAGSLGSVLKRMKADAPEAFQSDFRRFGIDVAESGEVLVVDPETGAELQGSVAVKKIIDDKRLVAPFQRAGMGRPFRIAQLQIALEQYFPGSDKVRLTVRNRVIEGKVSDVIRSEAGLATLMDRKVNTGKIDILFDVLCEVAEHANATTLAELAAFEKDIVAAVQFRKDYLADPTLSQPAEPPAKRPYNSISRGVGGKRGSRSGGGTRGQAIP